ncbi:von Willebrand factor A domain-containing protein 5A-like [Esox lucius]|uniref:von Willebrand factor A domain-containing protein 5A-like n=1 Tax=Esox lucius TaxID=8010 RepID=UPI00147745EC|nr:von Willebrand factor A domain-containing protein 5A-like [Esox lucius]
MVICKSRPLNDQCVCIYKRRNRVYESEARIVRFCITTAIKTTSITDFKAQELYDDALSSGQQAFLLEESNESPDVFKLSVGSLPPGEKASISLDYVTELAVQADDGLRLCLPAVLNPRYKPQGPDSAAGTQVSSVPAGSVPYSLSLRAHVTSPHPISKVESNCPLEPLNYLNTEKTQATVSLAAGHKFDRDVELLVYYQDAHKPTAIVEAPQTSAKPGTLMGDPVVMLSLYPEFPKDVMSLMIGHGEFIFVVDRSGSMDSPIHSGPGAQNRIGSARDTLLLLLKSLPMGCYFNIIGFGSSHEMFFPKLTCPQIFLFTDGEVWNTKEVLDLVKMNSGSHRLFSFGIGEGASSALISGMAKQGGGHAQFITGQDRMQPKVMQSLRFALQPAVVDISVNWNVPKGVSVTPLSPPIRVVFQGQRALLYAQLTGESPGDTKGSVTVKYSLAEKPVENQLSFSLKPAVDTGLTVHRLGAQTLIRSLEMEERERDGDEKKEGVKEKVVELSIQSGVISAFTAFIAVQKGVGKAVQGPLLHRQVPTPMMYGSSEMMARIIVPPRRMVVCRAVPRMMSCEMAAPRRMACSIASSGWLARCRAGRMDVEHQADHTSLVEGDSKHLRKAHVPAPLTCAMAVSKMKKISFWLFSKEKHIRSKMSKSVDRMVPQSVKNVDDQADHCTTSVELQSPVPLPTPENEPLLQLISLQKASGSWILDPALAEVLGKPQEDVAKPMPAQVNQEVWATVLALVWLYGFKMEAQEEWQFLAIKAVSWIKAQKGSYSRLMRPMCQSVSWLETTFCVARCRWTQWGFESFTLPDPSLSPIPAALPRVRFTCYSAGSLLPPANKQLYP